MCYIICNKGYWFSWFFLFVSESSFSSSIYSRLNRSLLLKLDNKPKLRFVFKSWLALVLICNNPALISLNFSRYFTKIRVEIWIAKAYITCSILEFQGIKLAVFYII